MKKLILLVVCALLTTLSFAQTEQGKVVLSGSTDLSFSSMKSQMEYDGENVDDEVTATNFSFSPSIGYFIMDNLALSVGLEFESEKQGEMMTSSLMVGPGIRYYFGSTNIKPFVQGDFMFGSVTNEYDIDFPNSTGYGGYDEFEFTQSAMGYDLGAGVAVFLNQHIALDFGLGYASATLTYDEDSKAKIKTSGIVFAAGISVHL